jgi:hypothetical protein
MLVHKISFQSLLMKISCWPGPKQFYAAVNT